MDLLPRAGPPTALPWPVGSIGQALMQGTRRGEEKASAVTVELSFSASTFATTVILDAGNLGLSTLVPLDPPVQAALLSQEIPELARLPGEGLSKGRRSATVAHAYGARSKAAEDLYLEAGSAGVRRDRWLNERSSLGKKGKGVGDGISVPAPSRSNQRRKLHGRGRR